MHLNQPSKKRFEIKHRLYMPAIMASFLLLPLAVRAQWLTQSFELKEGWNAIYLHVDASHANVVQAIGSTLSTIDESPIESIWAWQPRANSVQFIESPKEPVLGSSYWLRWRKGEPVSEGDGRLSKLRGNTACLVKLTGKTSYKLKIKGKPVPPRYTWTTSGLNFIGFPTPLIGPPSFDQYLVHAPELYRNSEIYLYGGGDLLDDSTPAREFNLRTSMLRGQAMWIKGGVGQYNNYFGPLKVSLQDAEGIHFGNNLSQYRVIVNNMTDNPVTIKLASIASETPPDGHDSHVGAPPLVIRGELNTDTLDHEFEALPSGGREWSLKPKDEPGSGVEIILGLDRASMSQISGDRYAGLLQITDNLGGVNLTQIDLPVTATVPSLGGLWVGEALVTEVRHDLTDYVEDKTEQPSAMGLAHLGGASLVTVTGWIRLPGLPDENKIYGIVGEETTTENDDGSKTQSGSFFAVNHKGKLSFNDGTKLHLASNSVIRPNAWNHVAAVFKGTVTDRSGEVRFYLNGASAGAVTVGVSDKLAAAAAKTELGNTGTDQSSRLVGDIYNLRIYDLALSGDQVKYDFNRQFDSIKESGGNIAEPTAGPLEQWSQGFADPSGRRPAGRNATFGKVRRPYKLRMLFHRDVDGTTRLLQRVYSGPDKDGKSILATGESSLNASHLDLARRMSVMHLPYKKGNVTWKCDGTLAMSGSLGATVEIEHGDHSGNPFLHTYHPDHDNLDARFKEQEKPGLESWRITRGLLFTFQDKKPGEMEGNLMFGMLDWGSGLIGGEYREVITLEGKKIKFIYNGQEKSRNETRQYEVRGAFALRRISEIDTLAMD
ncbi:LamG domain-containing protein [bacterium]|nr:LamG domain-containing protein [bacterium]